MTEVLEQHKTDHLKNLITLIRTIRNSRENSSLPFDQVLRTVLTDQQEKVILREQLVALLLNSKFVSLLTEFRIGSNLSFTAEAVTKLGYKFLPPVPESDELRTQINHYFDQKNDYVWVNAIPDEEWAGFLQSIFQNPDPSFLKYLFKEVLNSILIISQRAAALGIEPEVVSKIPRIDDLDSPFLGLSREVMLYVEKLLNQSFYPEEDRLADYKHIIVMANQCTNQLNYIYKRKDLFGISLRLTYLVRQLSQYITRLIQLLDVIESSDPDERWLLLARLLKEFVYNENTKYSLRKHFSINLQLLTFKVIENTSKTGEHYIATSPQAYWQLFRKALGGGVIVAFLCCSKARIYFQHFPIFWEAFFYSLNYSLGFMLIHILHFTLATKQPAMTASTIAAGLSNNGENPNWLTESTLLLTKLIRSQFISLVGNAIIAFPVAYGLSWLYFYGTGQPVADYAKSIKLINELNPWSSLAMPHAAIAGVYLMVSGLISGYYENKWVYNQLTARIARHRFLLHVFGSKKLTQIANYLERNVGGLAGNFYLGIFLGSTSAVGFTLGIPLDIRHITFASGNFGIAVASLQNQVSPELWINSILGIGAIGIVNVLVSFGLSILFALNSRNARMTEVKSLLRNLLWHFYHHSASFFFPISEYKTSNKLTESETSTK